jgi:dTDP-4-dehydrorhamnose reductase
MSVHTLITGSNGLLGSSLVRHLTEAKVRFAGTDLGPCANQHLGEHPYEACDLTDPAAATALVQRLRPRVVIHGAAMTAVDLCESEREQAYRVNVEATATMARAANLVSAKLIYVSTDYVFDGATGGYGEGSPLSPLGVYAVTKAQGELVVRTLAKDYAITRTAVPYGPFSHVKKDFVRWLREELAAKRPVRIVTDQVSNPTYAPDLARMLHQVAETRFSGVLHLAGATSVSRFDFAQAIAKAFLLDAALIQPIRTRDLQQAAPRPLDASLTVEKAAQLGFQPLALDAALRALKGAPI